MGSSIPIDMLGYVSPVLDVIASSADAVADNFNAVNAACGRAFNLNLFHATRDSISEISISMAEYYEELERIRALPGPVVEQQCPVEPVMEQARLPGPVQPPTPPPNPAPAAKDPVWKGVMGPEVFVKSGAERFEQEFKAASKAAEQLYKDQQEISARAARMKVTPPGMLNDVASVQNEIQRLSVRIQEINDLPVKLVTDKTNNELESLRNKMSEMAGLQSNLKDAMSSGDFGAINASYQKLSAATSAAEQNIRNNFTEQEKFNSSIGNGETISGGLFATIKKYSDMLINAKSVEKTLNLADSFSQASARLNTVNYGLDTSEQLQKKIFESAQRSHSAYQLTADAVEKLGTQARGAFSSNDEVIAFTEQLNKNFAVAGTSAKGVDAAMSQVVSAMASGKLESGGLNAIMQNTPSIVQNIADYMGVPIEDIKKMAAEGSISAETIKNAMFAASEETNAQFAQMPMTFAQTAAVIKNQALMAFQPVLQQLSSITQSEGFGSLVSGVMAGIQILAESAVMALNMMGAAVVWVQENWSWLAPVIGGVMAAVVLYTGAVSAYNAIETVSCGLKALSAVWSAAHGKAVAAETLANTGMTASQLSLNAAMLACPLTWIVGAVILLIAALYAGVAIFNKFTGSSVSATGIIAGAFGILLAHINNQFIVPLWNGVAALVNFLANAFHAPMASIKILVLDMAVTAIGYIQVMAQAIQDMINRIPGVEIDIVTGLDSFKNDIISKSDKIKSESDWVEVMSSKDYMDYGTAGVNMYKKGDNIESGIKDTLANFGLDGMPEEPYAPEIPPFEGIESNTADIAASSGNTAGNTAAMADNMDLLDEDLKYMRDSAEQEIINRFTLAELKLDVNNNNTLTQKTDFDDMVNYIANLTGEVLNVAAEGGHL